jgi:SAM-dependent methyltransferase
MQPHIHDPTSNPMSLLAPRRRFDPDCPELIDRPGVDQALIREELEMLENTNRRFGGHSLILHYVQHLLKSEQTMSASILDLGTGSADIPRAIAAWFRKRQGRVNIAAVDGNPDVLKLAVESCRNWPEIRLEQHDLRSLPYAADSYDLVLCSLALHHFTSADAITILRRMQEIARVGYLVNDLRRSWPGIWITHLLARTVIKSRIVRHDAPQSFHAAFTIRELQTMGQQAGLRNFRIKRHQAGMRMVLEGRK